MKKDFKKTLSDFQKLATDFMDFSERKNGWSCAYYVPGVEGICNHDIWCYFSDDRGHKAFTLKGIGCNFFCPIKFDGFTLDNIDKIDEYIKNARDSLNVLIKDYEQEGDAYKKRRENERIKYLEEELKSLTK